MSSNQRTTEVARGDDERHADCRPTSAVAPLGPPQAVAGRRAGGLRGAGLPRRSHGRHRRAGGRLQASAVSAFSRETRTISGSSGHPLRRARGEDPQRDDRDKRQQGTGVQKSQDRKSTRLNSSHLVISYAVFCLKKKKKNIKNR